MITTNISLFQIPLHKSAAQQTSQLISLINSQGGVMSADELSDNSGSQPTPQSESPAASLALQIDTGGPAVTTASSPTVTTAEQIVTPSSTPVISPAAPVVPVTSGDIGTKKQNKNKKDQVPAQNTRKSGRLNQKQVDKIKAANVEAAKGTLSCFTKAASNFSGKIQKVVTAATTASTAASTAASLAVAPTTTQSTAGPRVSAAVVPAAVNTNNVPAAVEVEHPGENIGLPPPRDPLPVRLNDLRDNEPFTSNDEFGWSYFNRKTILNSGYMDTEAGKIFRVQVVAANEEAQYAGIRFHHNGEVSTVPAYTLTDEPEQNVVDIPVVNNIQEIEVDIIPAFGPVDPGAGGAASAPPPETVKTTTAASVLMNQLPPQFKLPPPPGLSGLGGGAARVQQLPPANDAAGAQQHPDTGGAAIIQQPPAEGGLQHLIFEMTKGLTEIQRGQTESNKTIAAMMLQQLNTNQEFAHAAAQVFAAQEKSNEEEKTVSRPRLIYTDSKEVEAMTDNMKDVLAEPRFWSTGSDLKAWVNSIPEEIGPKRSNYNLEVSLNTRVISSRSY